MKRDLINIINTIQRITGERSLSAATAEVLSVIKRLVADTAIIVPGACGAFTWIKTPATAHLHAAVSWNR
jgi:hypothetical protein